MQPREKLQVKGSAALTNHELLKAVIGSGNTQASVGKIASSALAIINKCGPAISYADLEQVKGLGTARICEILAALELSRRLLESPDQPIIDSPAQAFDQLRDLGIKRQEHFAVLTLDGASRLINRHIIGIGTLTASLIHPREVFAPAIVDRAASIIVAHNHPSGSLMVSAEDRAVTKRLAEAGHLLDIPLLDHILIAGLLSKSILEIQ